MSEKYYLPVLYTEEERKKYAEWGIKKERFLMPFAVVTIIIDLLVIVETGVVLFKIREREPYFSAFLSTYGGLINDIAYGVAIVLTALLIKPLDMILDMVYKKPQEPQMLCLTPTETGVRYMLSRGVYVLSSGTLNWNDWESAVLEETNEIHIGDEIYRIGLNTIESIYPKNKQHAWMDRPEEKVENSIHLKNISRNFRGYLLSLEEKKKEAEWYDK